MRRWGWVLGLGLLARLAGAQPMSGRLEQVTFQPATAITSGTTVGLGRTGYGWAARWHCIVNVTATTGGNLVVALQASADNGVTFTDFWSTSVITTVSKYIVDFDTRNLTAQASATLPDVATSSPPVPLVPDNLRTKWTLSAGTGTFSLICEVGGQ